MSLGICPHAITQLSQSEEVDPPGYLSSYLSNQEKYLGSGQEVEHGISCYHYPKWTCYNLNMKVCLDSLLQCLVLMCQITIQLSLQNKQSGEVLRVRSGS